MSSGGSPPKAYNPSWQPGADQQFQQQAKNTGQWATSIPSTVIPQFQSIVSQQQANPGAQGAMSTANQIAALGQPIGQAAIDAGSSLYGAGQGALGYGNQVMQTGFDPQQALYNRTLQQTTDAANANNAMYGLTNSPYGAGVANQANQNFNIDWQNQQLMRQLQALSGYDANLGAAGGAFGTAANLGDQGLATIFQSGLTPYNTATGINQNNLNFLTQGTAGQVGALAPGFEQQQSDLGYLKTGQGATQLNQNAWAQQQQANANLWGGVGSIAGDLIGAFI